MGDLGFGWIWGMYSARHRTVGGTGVNTNFCMGWDGM